MNLGAGLAASDSFFQAQEHTQDRAYLDKQRAYDTARMQSGLDTLPDQTAADKARLGLSTDVSNAGRQTLPGQTANTIAQQGLDKGGLDFKAQQQPVEQANTVKQTTITTAGLDSGIAQLPELEKKRVAGNADADNARHVQSLVTLGNLVSSNDKAGALAHVNAVADAESLRAGTKGKKFTDIVPVGAQTATGDTRAYNLIADDGSTETIPFTAISKAVTMAKTGKYSMHEGKAGEVNVLNENTGEIKTPVPRDPNYASYAGNNQHTPAILQMAQAYKKADPNLTDLQALDKAKTSTEKPRHQVILDLVSKTAMPNSDINKEYQKWADLYDKARSTGAPGISTLSNSPADTTINPARFQSLFQKTP